MSVVVLFMRTAWSFFSVHHYFTAIFGAIYVLFKKHTDFDLDDIFQWRVLSLIFLINIGINQTRVMGIYESYQIDAQEAER